MIVTKVKIVVISRDNIFKKSFSVMSGNKLRALNMTGKCCTTEQHSAQSSKMLMFNMAQTLTNQNREKLLYFPREC
jgi:hypothetical protein